MYKRQVLGGLLAKPFRLDIVETASVMYPNCTNMVIPLVIGAFGEDWVIYVTCYSMVQTILVWTHARILISGKRKISLRDLVCNVNILAIMLGLFLFVFQLRLPGVIQSAFSMAGDTIGPVAMLIIGMLMAGIDMQRLRSYRQIWKPVLLRLIALPVILVCVAKYSGLAALAPHGETLIIISLLSVICLLYTSGLAQQFHGVSGKQHGHAALCRGLHLVSQLGKIQEGGLLGVLGTGAHIDEIGSRRVCVLTGGHLLHGDGIAHGLQGPLQDGHVGIRCV